MITDSKSNNTKLKKYKTRNYIKYATVSFLSLGIALNPIGYKTAYAATPVSIIADPIAQIESQLQIAQSIQNTINTIQSVINLGTQFVDSLRLQTGQQTINSKAEVTAMGNIADTQDQRIVAMRISDEKLRALNGASSGSSTCNVITGNIGGQSIEQAVAMWREQVMQAQLSFNGGGNSSPSRAGVGAGLEGELGAHCKNNATQLDVDQGICQSVTQQPTALGQQAGLPIPEVGSDLNADLVMSGILGRGNGVLSNADMVSSLQFLGLSMTGVPLGKLTPSDTQGPDGRLRVQMRNIAMSRQSVAQSAAGAALASLKPVDMMITGTGAGSTNGTIALKDWAEGTAKVVLGYDPNGNNFPDGVSKNAWLSLRAAAWFMNPKWQVQLDTRTNSGQTLKDIALMNSYMTYQNDNLYHQVQTTNFLLAQIVAILNENKKDNL